MAIHRPTMLPTDAEVVAALVEDDDRCPGCEPLVRAMGQIDELTAQLNAEDDAPTVEDLNAEVETLIDRAHRRRSFDETLRGRRADQVIVDDVPEASQLYGNRPATTIVVGSCCEIHDHVELVDGRCVTCDQDNFADLVAIAAEQLATARPHRALETAIDALAMPGAGHMGSCGCAMASLVRLQTILLAIQTKGRL